MMDFEKLEEFLAEGFDGKFTAVFEVLRGSFLSLCWMAHEV
jgi:hypothetical protein